MQEKQEIQILSLGWEDALEKEMATHSSILAWKILQAEKPGGLLSWVRKIPWRRKWKLTPVFLPKKFHRQRSLVGYVHGVTKSLTRPSARAHTAPYCLRLIALRHINNALFTHCLAHSWSFKVVFVDKRFDPHTTFSCQFPFKKLISLLFLSQLHFPTTFNILSIFESLKQKRQT